MKGERSCICVLGVSSLPLYEFSISVVLFGFHFIVLDVCGPLCKIERQLTLNLCQYVLRLSRRTINRNYFDNSIFKDLLSSELKTTSSYNISLFVDCFYLIWFIHQYKWQCFKIVEKRYRIKIQRSKTKETYYWHTQLIGLLILDPIKLCNTLFSFLTYWSFNISISDYLWKLLFIDKWHFNF